MMRYGRLIVLCCLLAPAVGAAQGVVPYPNERSEIGGTVRIPGEITVSSSNRDFAALIPNFVRTAQRYFGIAIMPTSSQGFLQLDHSPDIQDTEGYRLRIEQDRIVVEAGSPAGCFYGLQSVLQLLATPTGLRTGVLVDRPRYEWRGLLLDEARHFFGVEQVKSILDLMALQKLNRFHWHLTDTSGWRLEIKRYPRLTSIGATGNATNPDAVARYYTQEEAAEIIRYAQDRFIEVIPEIDMPGHATAAVRAYPELDGGGSEANPSFTFNPGKEATYRFLADVLREVALLFPSQYIHIGGDEVRMGNEEWSTLPEVKQLMADHNLATLLDVEHYFLRRMADVVTGLGRTVIVWDEALAARLPSESTVVMWWRHNRPQVLQQALDGGYQVVMCPRIPLYFDFVQHDTHTHGRKWAEEHVPLESVHAFPVPGFVGGVNIDTPLIKGIQANVWTDRIHTNERLQFMLYPRMSALAEAAWTNESGKEWQSFRNRVQVLLELLTRNGIRFYDFRANSVEVPGPGGPPDSMDRVR